MSGMAFSKITGAPDHEAVQVVLRTDDYTQAEFLAAVKGLLTDQHRYTVFTRAYAAEDLIAGGSAHFSVDARLIEESMRTPNLTAEKGGGSGQTREQFWESLQLPDL